MFEIYLYLLPLQRYINFDNGYTQKHPSRYNSNLIPIIKCLMFFITMQFKKKYGTRKKNRVPWKITYDLL